MSSDWAWLKSIAEAEVRRTLHRLPAALRQRAAPLPVTYERVPNAAILADGFEPDLLGLFVGKAFDEEHSSTVDLPAQIILFLDNLWDFADRDEEVYRDEVRTTYLHELGHYLGLDELDLEARGLE
ncbi:MAG: metallopeptidase family protein [Verrucomicrobia bacterium]|nr:metallopeptidase family protein [Verrucomicrobiota bacterium]